MSGVAPIPAVSQAHPDGKNAAEVDVSYFKLIEPTPSPTLALSNEKPRKRGVPIEYFWDGLTRLSPDTQITDHQEHQG